MAARASAVGRRWPDRAAVWRWHFHAGLFCIPLICWLAVTGLVYLFRPDVEALLARPYEQLRLDGPRAAPSRETQAAVAAVPGATFSRYQPPATPTGAAQVVVAKSGVLTRVYVDPRAQEGPTRCDRGELHRAPWSALGASLAELTLSSGRRRTRCSPARF